LYAEAFDAVGAIDKLEGFASFFGADFYKLPRNTEKITLEKLSWQVPAEIKFGDSTLVPMRAGEKIHWKLM
jgi:dihydroorotase